MITTEDRNKILEIAKRYHVSKVYLFGSALYSYGEPNDIDLAVEGISDVNFFRFYSELIFALSKPVDLTDLRKKSVFNNIIKSEGILLYG